jgi:hypothetical protein
MLPTINTVINSGKKLGEPIVFATREIPNAAIMESGI